jgi:hypothetical protein
VAPGPVRLYPYQKGIAAAAARRVAKQAIAEETGKWAKVIRAANIKVE